MGGLKKSSVLTSNIRCGLPQWCVKVDRPHLWTWTCACISFWVESRSKTENVRFQRDTWEFTGTCFYFWVLRWSVTCTLLRQHLLSNMVVMCLCCSFVAWNLPCATCKIDIFHVSPFFNLIQHSATLPKMWWSSDNKRDLWFPSSLILACCLGRPFLWFSALF